MKPDSNVWIVIPSYNEGKSRSEGIYTTVQKLTRMHTYSVVVVDDGSIDMTEELLTGFPVWHCRHPHNLGQGAALQTGIEFALKKGAEFIVTFDADGQHPAEEIPNLLAPLKSGAAEVALGSRFLDKKPENLPLLRRLVLKLSVFTMRARGINISDTSNGFRAFSRKAAQRISIMQNGMAHAPEIVNQIAGLGLKFVEVPVTISYTDYSLGKGMKISGSINVVWDLITMGKRK